MNFEIKCQISPQNTIPPRYYLYLMLNIDGDLYLDQIIFDKDKEGEKIYYSKLEKVVESLDEEKRTNIVQNIRDTVDKWKH